MYSPYQMYQQQQMPQTQNNNGYVIVRSEDEARNYPLAPGFSMTFFNETQPYCYKKTMSYSPLDHPTFEVYKIVKEEETAAVVKPDVSDPEWKSEIETLYEEMDILKREIQTLKAKQKPVPKKREDVRDDSE